MEMQYDLALDYELVAGGVMAGVVTKRGVGVGIGV